jgi:hypothetical protein
MLPPPASPQVAALSGLAVAAGFLAVGYLVVEAIAGNRPYPQVIRVGLALPTALTIVLLLLLAHVATGGHVLSEPWATRGAIGAIAVTALALRLIGRRSAPGPSAAPLVAMAVVALLAVALWGYPATRLLPLDHAWDSDFHAGLANELINGETLPHGTVTGAIPNDYPWMYHALLATTASFMPGGRAQDAFDAAFFFQVIGGVLTLFALGWELTRRWFGGAAAALFGGLSGGFGYLVRNGPAIVIDPRAQNGSAAVRRWGDMLFVRSYNMSFNNLAPTFPRDIGFALLPAFLLLMMLGFKNRSLITLAASGGVLGLIGLSTGESMFAGVGTAVVIVALPPAVTARPKRRARREGPDPDGHRNDRRGPGRLRIAAALLIPSLGLWSLWIGPLAYNYFKFGGFTGSANRPVLLPASAFLGAWGIAAIFAVVGVVVWLPAARRDAGARIVLAMMVVVAGLLVFAHLVPLLFSQGFSTFSREHRYWPLMYLPLALLAAVGATRILVWIGERSRGIAVVVGLAVTLMCIPSPLLASAALPSAKPAQPDVERALTGHRAMLSLLSPAPGMRCVAATTPAWSHAVFAFSGYRLVLYRWSRHIWKNSAHIRYLGIYDQIPSTHERVAALKVLLSPHGQRQWQDVARRWNVNVVTIPGDPLPAWMDRNYRVERTEYKGAPVSVVWIKPCSG